ncbi:pantoate kinase [uncultured Methanosphaera sp.]|uniref:pantoate kinase n=1 Tax=uncultured Methanosphaera sp. TaxID=262501 RepID=UPI0025F91F57|nr:pantoate kinase [uncultured Methanosphaera sp.]
MIKELKVFVPAHITGFFEIIGNNNPALKGSKGAGITLDEGVVTSTSISNGTGNINITVNGEIDELNTISLKTVEIIKEKYNLVLDDYDITINHELNLPIGAGFGTSASFALGISFTLPALFNISITYKEAGEIAHLAEISQSSGLGDVISELYGGCVIRLKEGSPVNGIVDKISITRPIYVITKTLGILETSEIIDNPLHQKRINKNGSILIRQLMNNPTMDNFIKLSREFAINTQLINDELQEILEIFDDETIGSSMAMLGNTAFALSYTPDTSIEKCNITKINTKGVQYIEKLEN